MAHCDRGPATPWKACRHPRSPQYSDISFPSPPMSNSSPAVVRKAASADPRVSRSTQALGAALVELLVETDFDEITVQRILDRAGVGRSTFYAHFRNKRDVLHSSYERMFDWLEQRLEARSSAEPRVAPVAEFLDHIAASERVLAALRSSGQWEEMTELGVGFFARIIERRIQPLGGGASPVPPALVAQMLAGALMEMIKWWEANRSPAKPAQMDATFHALALPLLRRASYEPARGATPVGGRRHPDDVRTADSPRC